MGHHFRYKSQGRKHVVRIPQAYEHHRCKKHLSWVGSIALTGSPTPCQLRLPPPPCRCHILASTSCGCVFLLHGAINCPFQISLSNPLTVAVSFVVQTRGPFAINPSPTKKRLRSGVGDGSGGGGSKNSTGGKSTMVVAQSASSPCRDSDATLAAHKRTATATAAAVTSGASGAGARAGARAGAGRGPGEGPGVATAPVYTTPQPSRGHKTASTETKTNATEVGAVGAQRQTGALVGGRGAETSQPDQARGGGTEGGRGGGTGRRRGGGRGVASASQQQAVKLLPGQNYQMELVFLPATASEDIEEALQSSFCPGSEVRRTTVLPLYHNTPMNCRRLCCCVQCHGLIGGTLLLGR